MKRIQSILLALAMLLSALAVPVFASDSADVKLTGAEITAYPGQTVEFPVVILQNGGFCGLNLYFTHSPELEFVSLTNRAEELTCTSNITTVWDGSETYSETGTLAIIRFAVPSDAVYGTVYTVEIHVVEAYDRELNPVSVLTTAGSVTVLCPHTSTVSVPEIPADCDERGSTQGVWCNDCMTYISGHELVPPTGVHVDTDGFWEWDEETHFHFCSCGETFDKYPHSGGTATCITKAVCAICNMEYGSFDDQNHTGGTTLINAFQPDHKEQTDGYSGDTMCLGCMEIIEYGHMIPAGEHFPGEEWYYDEMQHYKICAVEGCGVVIEGSQIPHFSTGENVSTCGKQAVCDVCGISYGEAGWHDFAEEKQCEETLKAEGTCREEAVYYYSCIL